MTSDTLLHDDPFHNEHTQHLFEAIDELRSCGADTDIGSLPELVIVGDQSTGRSSLLQSLTDIPFPVASRLCTRFPTRTVSRRTPNNDEVIKISLEPGPSDTFGAFAMEENADEKAARLEAYRQFAYTSPNMTLDDFEANVDQAHSLMGIKHVVTTEDGDCTVGKRNFARDVLKVELSGPNRSYFSILDVPGVFQSLTKDLTADEKVGVRDMVARYMQPSQSIIICVASGTNDLANQAAFDMASTHDLPLKRTVGVITKCDITQDKEQVLSLAQNKEKHLNHGWFVVRNRNPEEIEYNISSAERHDRERAFFDSAPWTKLPESRRGVQALKKYLADLLCKRIQDIFPTILETIKDRQTATSSELLKLGPARKTTEEKRTYLTALAQQFCDLASQGIRGRYHNLKNGTLKIRKHIREANDAFASQMRLEGHCIAFQVAPMQLEDRKRGTPFENRHDTDKTQPPHTSKPSLFGSQPSGGGLFGAASPSKTNVSEQAPSTKDLLFFRAPQFQSDPSSSYYKAAFVLDHIQHICASKPYDRFSPEELRLNDYLDGQSNPTDRATGGGLGSGRTTFGSNARPSLSNVSNPLGFGHPSNNASTSTLFPQSLSSAVPRQQPSQNLVNGTIRTDERSIPIYTLIREEVNNSRGTELQGTLNPDVLPALFHRQIAKWKDSATSHFSRTTKTAELALNGVIETACVGDDTVAQRIRSEVRQSQEAAVAQGLLQIRQRVEEIASRHLQTQNPMFEEQIRKARLVRFTAALERYRSTTPNAIRQDGNTTDDEMVIDMRNVTSLFDQIHMSNAQNLEDDIHDILKSYYELALGDFVEYVNQHVVESYVRNPQGPVLFFNPTYISHLPAKSIDELGAEAADVIAKRKGLRETLERLNRAEEIALKYL